jgi:hypothetical protein
MRCATVLQKIDTVARTMEPYLNLMEKEVRDHLRVCDTCYQYWYSRMLGKEPINDNRKEID